MLEFMLAFNVTLFLAVTLFYMSRRVFSIYHPATFYLFFHGFLFVVRPLFNYFYNFRFVYNFYEFEPSDYTKSVTLLCTDIGLICFMATSTLKGKAPIAFRRTVITAAHQKAFLAAAGICLPLALYSLISIMSAKFGDLESSMIYDKVHNKAINTTGSGYIHDANLMLIPITVFCAWIFKFRLLALAPFGVFALSRMLIGGARWTFLLSAAMLVLIYLWSKRRMLPSLKEIVIGISFLLVFSLIGVDRGASLREFFGAAPTTKSYQIRQMAPLEGMDFANQEYFEYIVHVVPDLTRSYDYFADNLILITGPIPRALWPGKPVMSPIEFFQLSDYGNPNGITMSLPGEGWKELGYLGVIIWCSLWGYIYGAIYQWFVNSDQSIFKTVLYFLILGVCVNFFRDGYLATFVSFIAFPLVMLGLWWAVFKIFSKQKKRSFSPSKRRDASASQGLAK